MYYSYHRIPADMTARARDMRKNMTRWEKRLWYGYLRLQDVHARRQKVIGPYIVDFCIHSRMLIIEVDGRQHSNYEGKRYDAARDAYLRERGYRVLRFTNREIDSDFENVCAKIDRCLSVAPLCEGSSAQR